MSQPMEKQSRRVNQLSKIKIFSTLKTDKMYDIFSAVRDTIVKKEAEFCVTALDHGLSIRCNTNSNITSEFKRQHGFAMDCARLYNTSKERMLVWYKVRDTIMNYYELVSADLTGNYIKTCSALSYYKDPDDAVLQKQFKNGACLYEPTDALLFICFLVSTITENFKGR